MWGMEKSWVPYRNKLAKCRENPRPKWQLSSIIILCPVWLPQVNFLLEKIYRFTIKMYDLLAHGSLSTFKRFKFYTFLEETVSVTNIPMSWKLQYTLFFLPSQHKYNRQRTLRSISAWRHQAKLTSEESRVEPTKYRPALGRQTNNVGCLPEKHSGSPDP